MPVTVDTSQVGTPAHIRFIIKHRVVQKNLVFVVGLSTRLADADVLKKQEYFGKYGKIVKVVINSSTSYAGAQVSSPLSPPSYNRRRSRPGCQFHVVTLSGSERECVHHVHSSRGLSASHTACQQPACGRTDAQGFSGNDQVL